MALQKQMLEFSFAGGFSEKLAKELLDPSSTFTRVQNLVHSQRGTLSKRPGSSLFPSTILGGSSFLQKGQRVFAYRDEIAVSDGTNLYSYSEAAAGWRNAGPLPECAVSRMSLGNANVSGAQASLSDVAKCGSYLLVLRQDLQPTGNTWIVNLYVYDAVTLTLVTVLPAFPNSPTLAATQLRIAASTTAAVMVAYGGSTLSISTFKASSLSINAQSPNYPTSIGGGQQIDACVCGSTLVAVNTLATSTLTVATFDANGNAISTYAASTTATGSALAVVAHAATDFFVGYLVGVAAYTSAIKLFQISITGSVLTSATSGNFVSTALGSYVQLSLSTSSAYLTDNGGTMAAISFTWTSAPSFTFGGSFSSVSGLYLRSRVCVFGSKTYAIVSPGDSSQHQAALVDVTLPLAAPLRPVAFWAPRLTDASSYQLTSLLASGTSIYGLTRTLTSSVGAGVVATCDLLTFDFTSPARVVGTQYGQSLAVSGGVATSYDGSSPTEINFWTYPYSVSATTSGTGTINGTYQICACFARVNSAGEIERSAPSVPITITPTNAQTVTYQINDTLAVTSKTNATDANPTVFVEFYRTVGGGTVFYFDCVSYTTSATSTNTDAQLSANAPLYRQPNDPGAELAHQCPPGLTGVIVHQDRLFGIGEDGVTIWYSSAYLYGQSPWFQSQTVITVDAGGRVRALGSMGGNLYIFQRDAIYIVEGSGPPANGGSGNEFSEPALLASDVGCIDPRSVVLTPMGLFFLSARGIYLVGTDNSVNFVGEDVQLTTAANPIMSSAVLNDTVGRVVFTLLPSEGSSTGVRLVYDYVKGAWSTDSLDDATNGPPGVGQIGAALTGGYATTSPMYTWITAAGLVYQETPTYLDNSTWITSLVETPPIHFAGILGFQRCWNVQLLLERQSPHDLLVEFAYDGAPYAESHLVTAARIAAMPSPKTNLDVCPKQQRCRTLQVRISDATPTGEAIGSAQGSNFVALRFAIGSKGNSRSAASEQV